MGAKAVNQPKGTKNESNSQLFQDKVGDKPSCKSTQRYKERKQFTTLGDLSPDSAKL